MKHALKRKRVGRTLLQIGLAVMGGSLAGADGAGSIVGFTSEADGVVSMTVHSPVPETSTVRTTTNLLDGIWWNSLLSPTREGPFQTGSLPGTNVTVYVQANHSTGFFKVGELPPEWVYYATTTNWASQTVRAADVVTIHNNAIVTLDRDDTAHTLRLGGPAQTGSLRVDQPFDLMLTDSITQSNGWIHISAGSVRTPAWFIYEEAGVLLDGGALHADRIENDGLVTVSGGLLGGFSDGVTQPVWGRDRFPGADQSSFATSDAEIARQVGRFWQRCNPADEVTKYRVSGGRLNFGEVNSASTQRASLVNTAAETAGRTGETGYRLSAVMQQDHQASSGFMGLVFHYQKDGSYYLFRVNGVGRVQMLVYSGYVQQSGTVLNISEAFAPVQNRLYELTVESVGLHTFNLGIVDTVTGETVFSTENVSVGGSFVKLDGGIGGIYATATSAGVDEFQLIALPGEERVALMDSFTDRSQGDWATSDAQIARQIGAYWRRCNPADELSQYRITDGKLDIGEPSPSVQRASLVNSAVQTSANGFRLSVVQQQDTTAPTAYMGLIFNYQEDGSYYLLRVSGAGTVQFLVYSGFVQQSGTVLNTSAFTPVQNRPYRLSVASSKPYTFDIRVIDKVTDDVVYSIDGVTVGGSFVRLQGGLGGVFSTHRHALFDNFHLDTVSPSTAKVLSGAGGVEVESGTVDLNGGTVSPLTLDSGLFHVSGGSVSLGRVSVGKEAPAEFRVTGDTAMVDLHGLDQAVGTADQGTFRFVFGPEGISPVRVSSWMDLGAAALVVDGSSYTGGPGRFTLFDSPDLIWPVAEDRITLTGFSGPHEAWIEQDEKRVELVYGTPALFEDVTVAAGMEQLNNTGPACWVDLNNNGWLDLIAGGRVWINNQGEGFTRGIVVGRVVAADFNNNGWTDLFSYSTQRFFRNEEGTLVEDESLLPEFPDPYVSLGAVWGDFNGNGWVDLYVAGYEMWDPSLTFPDFLLINNNGQSFTKTEVDDSYRARGVTACDFDQDGDLDIYVSNYRLQPNRLWRNDGSGGFTDVAPGYNARAGNGHSIGACWGDFNNNGLFDLFAGNFAHPYRWVHGSGSWTEPGQPESRFLRNRGPAHGYHFEDMGPCGVFYQESYASPAAADFDNSGRLDLFFTTVYQPASGGVPNYPVLFRNEGDFSFVPVDDPSLANLPPTYQAAWGDYNNNGQLDLLTAGKLLRNRGNNTNNWLKVRLEGDGVSVNRSAIGAQVRISVGSETLSRQVEGGTGQGNQNSLILHFGLGQHAGLVDLDITWPGGTVQTVTGVPLNQLVHVLFGEE